MLDDVAHQSSCLVVILFRGHNNRHSLDPSDVWHRIFSGGGRHLVEKADDLREAAVLERGEVGTLDRSVTTFGAELPGEAYLVALAVGLTNEGKAEVRELAVHACDESIDLVVALPLHEGSR